MEVLYCFIQVIAKVWKVNIRFAIVLSRLMLSCEK